MATPSVPAHALWVELSTRITTQKLHYRSGDEETAAASIYSLFKVTRELMTKHPEDVAFNDVALSLLNETLRPYTARWHGWMVEDKDAAPDKDGKRRSMFMNPGVRRKFREELRELNEPLKHHASCLEALRDGRGLSAENHAFLRAQATKAARVIRADLGKPLEMKIGREVPVFEKGPPKIIDEINKEERAEVLARRNAGKDSAPQFGSHHQDDVADRQVDGEAIPGQAWNVTALAFSGGGIRSATFCLGVAQALAKRGLFSQFDIMSTVSGGGYFGSFLSTFLGVDANALANGAKAEEPPQKAQTGTTIERPAGDDEKSRSARLDELFETKPLPGSSGVAPTLENGAPESAALRHLRTNSKYLLNGGAIGSWTVFGLVVSGILYNLLLLLPYPVSAAVLAAGCWQWGWWDPENKWVMPWEESWWRWGGWLSRIWTFFVTLLGVVLILLPPIQSWAHGTKGGTNKARWKGGVEVAALVLALLTMFGLAVYGLPVLFSGYSQLVNWLHLKVAALSWDKLIAAVSGLVTMLTGPAALKRSDVLKGAGVRKWMMRLFILSGPLFFLSLFLLVGNRLGFQGGKPSMDDAVWSFWTISAVAIGLLAWSLCSININTLAPHRYYRARLCECYLAVQGWAQRTLMMRIADWWKRAAKFERKAWENIPGKTGSIQKVPLTKLGGDLAAPYHLINAVVNLPSSLDNAVKGRGGDFFLFSKHFCGSPVVGYVETHEMMKRDPHLDLGTAMAISGAAASTNMGWKTLRHFRFLLALLNVRLGYWVPNPRHLDDKIFKFGPGVSYFLKELTGWMHERNKYINLSDGGHIENLAVYELLRRKCKFIVCVDAGMEPGMECTDLMRLQRYAKVDFGIHMHFDPTDLTVLPTRFSRAYAVLVKIDYAPPKKQDHVAGATQESHETSDKLGWMLYIKLAVTGTEPRYVLDYRRENPDFPHQSTGDQLYDEAQFEAYRALGEVAAASLFRKEIVGDVAPANVEQWFQQLADSLLPDNDEAFTK